MKNYILNVKQALIHLLIPTPHSIIPMTPPADPTAWREKNAYTLGVQAFVYGFPWLYLPTLRWLWVTQSRPHSPYAPVNQFWHAPRLADATYKDGGSPNNDTIYSLAWLDVGKEPLILSVPDLGDRYYTMEMASMDCDNFAYVGKRATGTKAGHYAILGPDWKGTLPAGVQALPNSRTPWVLIIGRTLVDGPDDVAAVHAIQQQYKLTPLSFWGKGGTLPPDDRDVWTPFNPRTDKLADWRTINRAMTENPPEARHAPLMKLFASIGVGPGQSIDGLDDATKQGLERASADGRILLRDALLTGVGSKFVNGWRYPPKSFGRAGLVDDFLVRGAIQCLGGILANDPAEAIYINTAFDAKGERLSGEHRYTLHFAKGEEPVVAAFWSITMYGNDHNLVDNAMNRYSIGDRTRGLKRDADGGLTIAIQADSPGADRESNWLPAPSGEFNLVLRTYMPSAPIIDQTWTPPAVQKNG